MADEQGISIALTPVQLYAILNGKSISQGELASNSWHEMPSARFASMQRFLGSGPEPAHTRAEAWSHQSHDSHHTPPGCWVPAPIGRPKPISPREDAVLSIIGGGVEMGGGVLLILTPEPTLITKMGGSALAAHGFDTTQAAIRQLFSGRPVADFTRTGATWAARQAGASERTAQRIGVVLDVAVPFAVGAGMDGVEKVIAIRGGRIIMSEEAVAGRAGRVSADVEEGNKALGKEGGHTLERHVDKSDSYLQERAAKSQIPDAVFSRFTSKEVAEEAINRAVIANRMSIRQWAINPSARPRGFELECGGPIGDGLFKATNTFQQLSKIRVVFKMSKSAGKAFYILSAYPIP